MKKTLRLVLGDQLNLRHSWFDEVNEEVTYLMAEMRQETDYVTHHVQKVVAFFMAMRHFADHLKELGHRVVYLKINDEGNEQQLEKILKKYLDTAEAEKFEYQLPDEYRLDTQLKDFCKELSIPSEAFDTEHFYGNREELAEFFRDRKQIVMEPFYRMMRKKHQVLMSGGQPEGGRWNYDKSNRKKWTGQPPVPHERGFRKNVTPVLEDIEEAGLTTMGTLETKKFNWPTTREDCLAVLNYFCRELLPSFGDYQDAMHSGEKFLFHSRLSFAMNCKMVSPREVIDKVVGHYRENRDHIHISQVEGFVRQVLGWREFMRGIYWREMPSYSSKNALDNHHKLPDFYWNGNTRMECLKQAIGQSLDHAYAHHIQRLMITGNFALLAQVAPDEVDRWYLGVYLDAIEWVELPNTRGMSQYADGGLVATKPYVSSANYINKMSNYCSNCIYSPHKKLGEKACPFNALYWNFLDEKKAYFKDNPRMSLMLSLLQDKDQQELDELRERARAIMKDPDNY